VFDPKFLLKSHFVEIFVSALTEMLQGAVNGFAKGATLRRTPVFSERGLISIHQDILMMENHIPYFVVDKTTKIVG
jgi:hypothetical protein